MRRAIAAMLLLSACSMSNRMHYLNRYASEARRLEESNRRFEANDYWGRATVKADSVLAHRRSGPEAGTALAVQGEARAALGQCAEAVPSLQRALVQPLEVDDREYAQLALGRCQLQLGEYARAVTTTEPVLGSRDRRRQEQARFVMGSAERRQGRDSVAFELLAGIRGKPAMLERAAAAVGAGHVDAARALVDSVLALRDSSIAWDGLVQDIGQHHPVEASALLTGLLGRGAIPVGRVPEALLADATRLAAVDTVAAQARMEQLLQLAPASSAGIRARREVALDAASRSTEVSDLVVVLDTLAELGTATPGTAADSVERAIRRITTWVDSAPPGAPQGDLRRFLAAELARDVVHAPELAVQLFQGIPEGWPDSPYAAKAWLAARQLTGDTAWAPTYEGSPYLAVLRGGDASQYAALEDSLARFARAELVPPRPRPGAGTAGARARPGAAPATQAPGARRPTQGARPQPRGRQVEELP